MTMSDRVFGRGALARGECGGCRLLLDQTTDAVGRDAAGVCADVDQFQLPARHHPIDGGA